MKKFTLTLKNIMYGGITWATAMTIVLWILSAYYMHKKTADFDELVDSHTQAGISFGVGYVMSGGCEQKTIPECSRAAVLYLKQNAIENEGDD